MQLRSPSRWSRSCYTLQVGVYWELKRLFFEQSKGVSQMRKQENGTRSDKDKNETPCETLVLSRPAPLAQADSKPNGKCRTKQEVFEAAIRLRQRRKFLKCHGTWAGEHTDTFETALQKIVVAIWTPNITISQLQWRSAQILRLVSRR